MNQTTEKVTNQSLVFSSRTKLYLFLVISVGAMLIGAFLLTDWAEAAWYGHATQHLLIFTSGVFSVLAIREYKKD